MCVQGPRKCRKLAGSVLGVVDARHHGPFETDSSIFGPFVCLKGLREFSEWIGAIDWSELVADLVMRRVQRDGQAHR